MESGPAQESDWRIIDVTLNFTDPELVELLGVWRTLCDGRKFPARGNFTPEALSRHLGWIILLDVEPEPTRFRFRLIGTAITDILGRDSTGCYLDELYDGPIRDRALSPYVQVVTHRRPIRSTGWMVHASKGHIRYEAIYLPFSDDGKTINLIMERVKYCGI